MITYRTYNTKIKPVPTWPTDDGVKSIEVHDPENRYVFEIIFGPNPSISIFEDSDEHNLDNEIHAFKVGEKPKIPSIEMADLLEGMNIAIAKRELYGRNDGI